MSVSLLPGQERYNLSYAGIVPQIYEYADSVSVMAYDMHTALQFTGYTGIHGALFPGPNDQTNNNAEYSVNLILASGGTPEKTLFGIPSYGVSFNLANPIFNGVGAPTTSQGPYTPYRLICQRLNVGTLTGQWEATQMVPYAFDGSFWIGYDDFRSVAIKANYINERNFRGAKWWVMDDDDYTGICGYGTFPLFRTVANIILQS